MVFEAVLQASAGLNRRAVFQLHDHALVRELHQELHELHGCGGPKRTAATLELSSETSPQVTLLGPRLAQKTQTSITQIRTEHLGMALRTASGPSLSKDSASLFFPNSSSKDSGSRRSADLLI